LTNDEQINIVHLLEFEGERLLLLLLLLIDDDDDDRRI